MSEPTIEMLIAEILKAGGCPIEFHEWTLEQLVALVTRERAAANPLRINFDEESRVMTGSDMRRFAELAQDFYQEHQVGSGMATPLRKVWATNEAEGLLIVVSMFGKHSRTLANELGIPWKESEPTDGGRLVQDE